MTKKSYFISIFPEIFETALRIGITKKALINKIVDFETINPISFLKDKEGWMTFHLAADQGC